MIKKHSRGIEIVFVFLIFFVVSSVYLSGFLERFELILLDFRYQTSPARPDPSIAIVAIDNSSLKELSQWPWPRDVHGKLVDRLKGAGAKVIGFDLDFSTPRSFEEDQVLVRSVQKAGNVVLGAFQESRRVGPAEVQYSSLPFPELMEAAKGVGTLSFPADLDGGVRRVFFQENIHGEDYWGFSVELLRVYQGLSPQDVRWAGRGQILIGNTVYSTDPHGIFYNHFVGPGFSFPTFSFTDVLNGRIDPKFFKNKIVLIGASSLELQDLWNTPFEGLVPGVEIQANVVNALLTRQTLYRLPSVWIVGALLFNTILWGCLYFGKNDRSHQIHQALIILSISGIFLLAGYVTLSYLVFRYQYVLMDTAPFVIQFAGLMTVRGVFLSLRAGQSVQEKSVSLEALHSVGGLAHARRSLEDVIDFVFPMLRGIIQIDFLYVEVFGDGVEEKVFAKQEEGIKDRPQPEVFRKWVMKTFETRRCLRVTGDFELKGKTGKKISSLFSPVMTHGKTLGVIHIHRFKNGGFDDENLKMLYTVASQLALVLEYEEMLFEMKDLFLNVLEAFSSALDFRDNDTEGHSQRVTAYCMEIGKELGLSPSELEVVKQGGLLHDIGKIGIPDSILNKPGPLTEEEYGVMKAHAEYGFEMLKNIRQLQKASLIVYHHQERYDGKGYPQGLRGEEIVIGARIFSVADTYDAITSDRVYRKGRTDEEAREEILRCSGTQFDPRVVEAFMGISKERMLSIREEIGDMMRNSSRRTLLFR